MYNLTIFDDIKTFLHKSPPPQKKKSTILDLPYFQKMPKAHEVALICFAIWRINRAQFIKKIPCVRKF